MIDDTYIASSVRRRKGKKEQEYRWVLSAPGVTACIRCISYVGIYAYMHANVPGVRDHLIQQLQQYYRSMYIRSRRVVSIFLASGLSLPSLLLSP